MKFIIYFIKNTYICKLTIANNLKLCKYDETTNHNGSPPLCECNETRSVRKWMITDYYNN